MSALSKANPEVWNTYTPAAREFDQKTQAIQKKLVTGLISLILLSKEFLQLSSVICTLTNYSKGFQTQ